MTPRRRKVVDVGLPGDERRDETRDDPRPARGKYLGYECPVCKKRRQTSAAKPPDRCAVCELDRRRLDRLENGW